MVDEKEIYLRFSFYDDEELLRILTAERALYRSEAVAAAEAVLMMRGITPPPALPAHAEPSVAHVGGRARPKSRYQFIDLCVDALLFISLYRVTGMLSDGTLLPGGGLLDVVMRLMLSASMTGLVIYTRHWWRTKEWKD